MLYNLKMKTTISIVKNIVLAKLSRDSQYDLKKSTDLFWEKFTIDLLNFEVDPKPLYSAIYFLELHDPEKIIEELSNIYSSVLDNLAEDYVLGNISDGVKDLLINNSKSFEKQVHFYKTQLQVIKNIERKRIKKELPKLYDRLTFELSDADIENAAKKKGREALKQKMKVWDDELLAAETETVLAEYNYDEIDYPIAASLKNEGETRVIPISWIKYAVAACILITASVFYFKSPEQMLNNSMEDLVYAITVKKDTVLFPTSLGFAATKMVNIIEIQYRDASLIISKLNNKIKEEGNDSMVELLKNKLKRVQDQQGKYEFDGKKLSLYSNQSKQSNLILTTDWKTYFLQNEELFYKLKKTKKPEPLIKVNDPESIEQLEKIIFDNE
jgi:hypothetical protein